MHINDPGHLFHFALSPLFLCLRFLCRITRKIKTGIIDMYARQLPVLSMSLPQDLDPRRTRALEAAYIRSVARAAKAKNTYQTPKK